MGRRLVHKWFRLNAEEILGKPGPSGVCIRDLLLPQERSCWYSLCAMCAQSDFPPAICKQPFVGFLDKELVLLMKVHHQVWTECKQKLIFAGVITVDANNVIIMNHWEHYGSDYARAKVAKGGILPTMTEEEALKVRMKNREKQGLFKKIIDYLNDKASKNFRISSKASYKHFSARFDEGYGWDDFKHVIDVKCQRWLGDDEMEMYLRPETLFNSEKFESYRQERLIVRKAEIGGLGSLSIMPDERKKYEAKAKVLYEKKKAEVMKAYGAETEDDWYALMLKGQAFTFDEFFKAYLRKLRQTPVWSLDQESKETEDD